MRGVIAPVLGFVAAAAMARTSPAVEIAKKASDARLEVFTRNRDRLAGAAAR